MQQQPYDQQFFTELKDGSLRSAEAVVPMVQDLVGARSVIDVGCGIGTWLSVFRHHGAEDIFGVDGEYVDPAMLLIPSERFISYDLTQPLHANRRFDLAVSLEVAEHLPATSAAEFVAGLTRLAPVVMFSAAIPNQGGTHHINEQWQDYWADLFAAQGYLPVDYLRRKIWRRQDVEFFYAQNTILYVEKTHLLQNPRMRAEYDFAGTMQLSMVHPVQTLYWNARVQYQLNAASEAVAAAQASAQQSTPNLEAAAPEGTNGAVDESVIIRSAENVRIGDNVRIEPFTIIYGEGGVEIQDNVRVGAHVVIGHADRDEDSGRPVIIERDVVIGPGAVLVAGVTIGRGAVVGPGAVITRDIAPLATVKRAPVKRAA